MNVQNFRHMIWGGNLAEEIESWVGFGNFIDREEFNGYCWDMRGKYKKITNRLNLVFKKFYSIARGRYVCPWGLQTQDLWNCIESGSSPSKIAWKFLVLNCICTRRVRQLCECSTHDSGYVDKNIEIENVHSICEQIILHPEFLFLHT